MPMVSCDLHLDDDTPVNVEFRYSRSYDDMSGRWFDELEEVVAYDGLAPVKISDEEEARFYDYFYSEALANDG